MRSNLILIEPSLKLVGEISLVAVDIKIGPHSDSNTAHFVPVIPILNEFKGIYWQDVKTLSFCAVLDSAGDQAPLWDHERPLPTPSWFWRQEANEALVSPGAIWSLISDSRDWSCGFAIPPPTLANHSSWYYYHYFTQISSVNIPFIETNIEPTWEESRTLTVILVWVFWCSSLSWRISFLNLRMNWMPHAQTIEAIFFISFQLVYLALARTFCPRVDVATVSMAMHYTSGRGYFGRKPQFLSWCTPVCVLSRNFRSSKNWSGLSIMTLKLVHRSKQNKTVYNLLFFAYECCTKQANCGQPIKFTNYSLNEDCILRTCPCYALLID